MVKNMYNYTFLPTAKRYFLLINKTFLYFKQKGFLFGSLLNNGCDEVLLNNQEGLLEKLERILSVKTDIVHVGICTEIIDEQTHKKVLCPKIQEIVDFLQKNNIKVVFGTHK